MLLADEEIKLCNVLLVILLAVYDNCLSQQNLTTLNAQQMLTQNVCIASADREWWFIFISTFDRNKLQGISYASGYYPSS